MKTISKSFLSLSILIGFVVFSRLLPHWPNVTALGAVAILSPSWMNSKKLGLLVPLVALLISDSIIGWHTTMPYTYVAMFLVSLLAIYGRNAQVSSARYYGVMIFNSSLLFFGITNFGVWSSLNLYPKTMAGLVASYWNALPFLAYEFMGTLFYLTALLVSVEILRAFRGTKALNQ